MFVSATLAGCNGSDEANELFVSAAQMYKDAAHGAPSAVRLGQAEKAYTNLNRIVEEHRSTDLAVSLASGQGVGIVSIGEVAKTLLRLASAMDDAGTVERLAKDGHDPNAPDIDGWTSLHVAAYNNSTNVSALLLRTGARIGAANEGGTPLHFAARRDAVEVAEQLIGAGADANVATELGRNTPLHYAARNDSIRLAQALIDAGARASPMNSLGDTPLHKAAERDSIEVAALLIKEGAVRDSRNNKDNTPLHVAAANDSVGVAIALLAAGTKVGLRGEQSRTPLHVAARHDAVGVARALVSAGAEVDVVDNLATGVRPLHEAAMGNAVRVAVALLEADADVQVQNIFGETPLQLATKFGSDDVETLLDGVSAPSQPDN